MKTIHYALATLNLIVLGAISGQAQTTPAPVVDPNTTTVFLIDDQTGIELARDHGIQPIQTSDLQVLINSFLTSFKPVHLVLQDQDVEDDASRAVTAQMDFTPFSGGPAPTPPSPNLPLSQLEAQMTDYRTNRAAWQTNMIQYRKTLVDGIENFVRNVNGTQAAVAKRFDDMLAARNGRDFCRSDIVGAITNANRLLGKQGRRILVLNTDAKDEPANRPSRKSPLTPAELDPAIDLVFVNKSHLPEQEILFQGIKNPIHHADSMQEAMAWVVSELNSEQTYVSTK